MEINWVKVWADFEKWYQKTRNEKCCSKCGSVDEVVDVTWDMQTQQIEKLVNKMVKK